MWLLHTRRESGQAAQHRSPAPDLLRQPLIGQAAEIPHTATDPRRHPVDLGDCFVGPAARDADVGARGLEAGDRRYEALVIYVDLDTAEGLGAVMVDRGTVFSDLGQYREAVASLRRSFEFLAGERLPWTWQGLPDGANDLAGGSRGLFYRR